jgi:hypothetical protein
MVLWWLRRYVGSSAPDFHDKIVCVLRARLIGVSRAARAQRILGAQEADGAPSDGVPSR